MGQARYISPATGLTSMMDGIATESQDEERQGEIKSGSNAAQVKNHDSEKSDGGQVRYLPPANGLTSKIDGITSESRDEERQGEIRSGSNAAQVRNHDSEKSDGQARYPSPATVLTSKIDGTEHVLREEVRQGNNRTGNKNTYGEPVKSEWRKRKKVTGNKGEGFEDLVTVFVDGLADYIDAGWLRSVFKECGVVKDAFIPAKRRTFTHLKFGFVRFKFKEEAERAIKKLNGVRRHDNIMKVYLAKYGRDRKRAFRQNPGWRPMEAPQTKEDLSRAGTQIRSDVVKENYRKSYRQALTGEILSRSNGDDLYSSQFAMEAIKSRVATLELEVARLQRALSIATSDGKLKVEVVSVSGDRVPAGSGEGSEEASKSGVFNADSSRADWEYKKEALSSVILGRDDGVIGDSCDMGIDLNGGLLSGKISSTSGQDCVTDISPKKGEKGESARSLSDDRWPAGSGVGSEEGSTTGVIDDSKSGDDRVSKKVDQETTIFDMDEGLFDARCDLSEDEEALNELELYRLFFDTSKDRMHKENLSRVEMEGDRKSCISVNIRKRTMGQKKKKVESKKRRNYASSRWLGVKRRFVHVFL